MDISRVKRAEKIKDAIIEAKDQRWHCRNRITLVFGSNDLEDLETYLYENDQVVFKTIKFHQAKNKAIEELLDNCIDEYYRGQVTEIHISLSEDNKVVTVEDNGPGMPLDKVVLVYSEFRTGSKFKDEEIDNKGYLLRTLGQNGLGAAATCLTSEYFKVRIRHYNSKTEQTFNFIDGAIKVNKSKKKSFHGHSGVRIELQLAKEVYKNDDIDRTFLRKRVIDLAYNNPGLTFYFDKEKFHFKKGLSEFALKVNPNAFTSTHQYAYDITTKNNKMAKGLIELSFSIITDPSREERERFISFVNSTPTFDGGFHHDRIKRLFINFIKEKLEKSARKEKFSIIDNDILQGVTFILGIVMPNPRFESQTKRKLVKDNHLDRAINELMASMDRFCRKNREFLDAIVERSKTRNRFLELKEASKISKKQKRIRVDKLLDANERRKRDKCTIFICEGDSAIGGLRSARNKLYHGGIALKGKPMNVAQASITDILNNKEFNDIMLSIGLTIGVPADIENLRYRKIVFLSDSDVDGGHINTLLANFFFTFWPELFAQGIIHLTKAPLFEVICEKKRLFAESIDELERIKQKQPKIREIQRNKGLGEMSTEAFKYVLNRETFTKITIEDMQNAKNMLSVCFGRDTNLRKELLIDKE
jgi:DNA gyrase/topoisomerase IV subunit B